MEIKKSPFVMSLVSRISLVFSLSAILVLILLVFFILYRFAFLGKELQNDVAALNAQVTGLTSGLLDIKQQTEQLDESLKQTITEWHQALNGSKDVWQVIEAHYYVKLANNYLLQQNVPTAIEMLQTADNEIKDLNDTKYDDIRRVLASDIANLKAQAPLDYTGIYMKLSAINNQIDRLPLFLKPTMNLTNPFSDQPSMLWWKKSLNETWQALQKIIVVRHHESGMPPLTAPGEQEFLRQNLHAIIEKTMWGLLNKNAEIYQASLQQASMWIKQYFVTDASLTQSVLHSIDELEHVNVNPPTPNISASLKTFHDYLDTIKQN